MTATAAYDPIPETCDEALRKWDAGETVFTVEMGGIGPGYEQAIQMLAFEMIRRCLCGDLAIPPYGADFPDVDEKRVHEALDEVVHVENAKGYGGFSGAQVGAAKNLAMCVVRRGYRTALRDPAVKDRLIQVAKKFPPGN
jgi:hypothetical protein